MFLVRTARSARGTASASVALAYLKSLETDGVTVKVTDFGGRRVSAADLERAIRTAAFQTLH